MKFHNYLTIFRLLNTHLSYIFYPFCICSLLPHSLSLHLSLVSPYFLQPFPPSVSLLCWHFIYLWSWHPWLTICQTAPLPNLFPLNHLKALINVLTQLPVSSQGFCHAHLWIWLLSVFILVLFVYSVYVLMLLIWCEKLGKEEKEEMLLFSHRNQAEFQYIIAIWVVCILSLMLPFIYTCCVYILYMATVHLLLRSLWRRCMWKNDHSLTIIRDNDLQWTLPGVKRDLFFACPFIRSQAIHIVAPGNGLWNMLCVPRYINSAVWFPRLWSWVMWRLI